MKYIVDFDVFEAAMVFAAKDDVRFYLNGIHLNKGRVESTNGHIAYMATIDKGREAPGYLGGTYDTPDLIINPRSKVPQKNKKKNIQYCSITIGDISRIDYLDFYGKVLCSDIIDVIDGKFPNIPRLFSRHKKSQYTGEHFGVNANYMAMFSAVLKREKYPVIKIHPTSKDETIMVSFQRPSMFEVKERAIVMPVRL